MIKMSLLSSGVFKSFTLMLYVFGLGSKIGGKHKSKEKVFGETGSLREVNKLSRGLDDTMKPSQQKVGDADPGVISEGESEDDFMVSVTVTEAYLVTCIFDKYLNAFVFDQNSK